MLWFEASKLEALAVIQRKGVIVDTSGQLCERH
jgi:hypothetical protein